MLEHVNRSYQSKIVHLKLTIEAEQIEKKASVVSTTLSPRIFRCYQVDSCQLSRS